MSQAPASLRRRAAELRRLVHRHEDLYYREGRPEISDREFDRLRPGRVALEAAHPDLVTADSPTRRVGGVPLEGFVQVRHQPPMQSLDNTYSLEELREWAARLERLARGTAPGYVAELKVDGVSVSLLYEDGVFARGATRGNGLVGDDVTAN